MLVPTGRLLILALGIFPVLPITGSYDTSLAIGALWLLSCFSMACVDGWFAPRKGDIEWTRDHDVRLSLGVWNAVKLTALNRTDRAITFQVRDALPRLMVGRTEYGSGRVSSGQSWTLAYSVYPYHRGDHHFGHLGARYLGPLGLVWRQHSAQLQDPVRVYPDVMPIRTYEALAQRGRLEQIGLIRSRRWGQGTEFERLRDYTPDDEYRRVNWKATARRGVPVVVDYEVERSQTLILAVDSGRLMSTFVPQSEDTPVTDVATHPNTALTRLDYALNTATLLAWISLRHADRVGFLAFNDHVSRYIPARSGQSHFVTLLEGFYNLEAQPIATSFSDALVYLSTRASRRSLVVLFTDLADPQSSSALLNGITRLLPRHLPLIVTLQDPGIALLARETPTDSRAVYRRAVARKMLDDREHTLRELRHRGVLTLDVPADRLSPAVVNAYMEVKGRGRL